MSSKINFKSTGHGIFFELIILKTHEKKFKVKFIKYFTTVNQQILVWFFCSVSPAKPDNCVASTAVDIIFIKPNYYNTPVN